MNAKGAAAYYQGEYAKALIYFFEALEYDQKHDLKEEQADVLNNIGLIYKLTDKTKEAISIYQRALMINKEVEDVAGQSHLYQSLSEAFISIRELENAILYIDSAIVIAEKLQDTLQLAINYNSKGLAIFELANDPVNAKTILDKAKGYLELAPNQEVIVHNYINLGKVNKALGYKPQAIKYFEQAYEIIKNTERSQLLETICEHLQISYNEIGDFKNAYKYLVLSKGFNDKVANTEKIKQIEQLQTQYQTAEKQKEIELQKLKLEKLESEKLFTYSLLGIFTFLVCILLYTIRTKINTNKLLKVKQKIIEKNVKQKELLLKEIHHRVKNNLQVISSLLSLQVSHSIDPLVNSAIMEGQSRVQSMSLIHQGLYHDGDLMGLDVKNYLEKLFGHLFATYNISSERIKLLLDIEQLSLDVDTLIPFLIKEKARLLCR